MEFYVKDDNNWGKDNGEKMEKAIEDISIKNLKKLRELVFFIVSMEREEVTVFIGRIFISDLYISS